jgi:hypothetical protein
MSAGLAAAALAGCAELSSVSVAPAHRFGSRMRIAVLDFDWTPLNAPMQGGHTLVNMPNAGKYLADSVSSKLLSIPLFEVLERSKLNQLLAERDLTLAEVLRKGEYQQIGAFLGVDYLVLGTVNTYSTWANFIWCGHGVSFSCRCVDIASSRVVWTISGTAERGPHGPVDPSVSVNDILNDALPKLRRQIEAQKQEAG